MKKDFKVDYEGLQSLVNFQIEQGVKGILAVGTTGESPTLNLQEHTDVIGHVFSYVGVKGLTIGGTGSNNTKESINATKEVADLGVECILLVDPYYNGPSSMEIRREYIAPIAERFPEIQIIPYVIPGRSGTQLLPQDLAILNSSFDNIRAVKEATGNIENMKLTRDLCGENFDILSGDDDKTFTMMKDVNIRASGVVSVASNIVPNAVQSMVQAYLDGKESKSEELYKSLKPFFSMVTVKTMEESPFGPVLCKARNPLPYKTMMNIVGMSSGPCRQPLGKRTRKGLNIILENLRKVYKETPELLEPIQEYFDVDLNDRLYNKRHWVGLYYD
jgi:4-hydroxy-tetrahydrodipicolinate synthase